jgi:hypothetical protein
VARRTGWLSETGRDGGERVVTPTVAQKSLAGLDRQTRLNEQSKALDELEGRFGREPAQLGGAAGHSG